MSTTFDASNGTTKVARRKAVYDVSAAYVTGDNGERMCKNLEKLVGREADNVNDGSLNTRLTWEAKNQAEALEMFTKLSNNKKTTSVSVDKSYE